MKRTPFKRRIRQDGPTAAREVKPWAQTLASATLRPMRTGKYAGGTSGVAVEKEQMLQHRGYEDAVRGLGYCMRCRLACRPQFCHADMGKGTGIKTDCRRGWPGCPDCHWLVGTSGYYTKEQRRAVEADLAQRTRNAVIAAGTWPARLPMFEGSPA
ncbi:MAG: hypothetical protein K0S48_48 [Ramlibacter sp.]|jgi:hypothetical protein|nr:hypothetical protein [Ramlibacter sp.]